MVGVSQVAIKNFRIHKDLKVEISPGVTVIIGRNGSGKTTILEAIYIALVGSSFKGMDRDIITPNGSWWRIDIEFKDKTKRQIKYDTTKLSGKKQILIDNKINYRLNVKNKIPVVLFEPGDLRLLNGSPSRRREFIDKFICQINPDYQIILNKYERALKQRNNLLKNNINNKESLFVWDVAISEYGSQIIEQRTVFIERLNSKIDGLYKDIAKTDDFVSIHYSHTYIGDVKQKLLNELNKNISKDRVLKYTTTGPHRHDVIFNFNNSPALTVASRGEVRTIIVALKFLEASLIEETIDIKPILLLDDVFSELDEDRQKRLLNSNLQTVITSTNTPTIKNKTTKIIKL